MLLLLCRFLISKKKTPMFTVWCRHVHSYWQSTEAFLYILEKYNITGMLTIYCCPWLLGEKDMLTKVKINLQYVHRMNHNDVAFGGKTTQCLTQKNRWFDSNRFKRGKTLENILVFDYSSQHQKSYSCRPWILGPGWETIVSWDADAIYRCHMWRRLWFTTVW